MKTILSVALGVTLALSAMEAGAQDKAADRKVELAIEQQSLADALNEWAKQTGLQLVSPSSEMLNSTLAPRIKGAYTATGALEELLKGTSLTYEWVGERAVAIREKSPVVPAAFKSKSTEDSPIRVARLSGAAESATSDVTDPPSVRDGSVPTIRLRRGIDAEEVEEVVVTGTHIRGVAPDSSPLSVYDRQAIERSGAATVDQLVRKIPQNFGLVGGDTIFNNGSNTTASGNGIRATSINLRGLGAESTLVLLNGRRVSPSGSQGALVDVSMIPLSAIERVEVLTDGASAIYGADAVAGVVNFSTRHDIEGAETSVRYGESTDGGAQVLTASQLLGGHWDSGDGFVVYEHEDSAKLQTSQRSYIPDQGGEFDILPHQRRNSILTSLSQELATNIGFHGNAFFNNRTYAQETILLASTIVAEEGEAENYGALAGLTFDLPSNWRGDFSANYGRTNERREPAVDGQPDPAVRSNADILAVEASADGAVFALPAGTARLAIGASAREEQFDDDQGQLSRKVWSAYGELFVPLLGSSRDQLQRGHRLELSLAARFDDYADIGSSTNPKVGVLWSPLDSLKLRGTYATSFRVPPLAQLRSPAAYSVWALPDPNASDGITVTLLPDDVSNPALKPEQSDSFTFGFDWSPMEALKVSATYFDIDFSDRIARATGADFDSLLAVYSRADVLGPFIHRDPDPAEVNSIFGTKTITDFTFGPVAVSPSDVEATLDLNYQNIARTRVRGIDLMADYVSKTRMGEFEWFLSGSYLRGIEYQTTSATPWVNLVDTVFNPVDLRLRSGLTWTLRDVSSSLILNYTDKYKNNLAAVDQTIGSWTTADWQLAYRAPATATNSLIADVDLILDVQNITDRQPPHVAQTNPFFNFGFDSTNASPRGRFVSLQVRKHW